MMALPIGFAQPLILLALLALPVLWWLLRLIPPRPQRIHFPPTRLLLEIATREETPARSPWWLILLRLILAALVIIAAAEPIWNPPLATGKQNVPLLILLDDGWSAAASWDARLRAAEELIARADADNRGVKVLPLSEKNLDISLQTPATLRGQVQGLKPKSYAVDRREALPVLERFLAKSRQAEIVWLSDGVDLGDGNAFVQGLKKIIGEQSPTIIQDGIAIPHALADAQNKAGALTVKVIRAQTGATENGIIKAIDLKGFPLAEAVFAFKAEDRHTEAKIELPVEIRNDVARLEIVGERSAGAVQLLDKRWRRRTIGIVSGAIAERSQPLLGANYYLSRALSPFADVRQAEGAAPSEAIQRFLNQHLPMLIFADVGNVAEAAEPLTQWIENGGVLVRFAGPHLAAADDNLIPVKLRRGDRVLGGSLSWDKPQPLAAFSRGSPFDGMTAPNDVTVSRQVLAEPDSQLLERTWATLADGTPLVTAERRGKGLIVLFHVTADPRWSNLPLSGAFVDMLRNLVTLAGTIEGDKDTQAGAASDNAATALIPPTRALDGFGAFSPPPPSAKPIPSHFAGRADADHPPGFYGPPEGLVAVNTLMPNDEPMPLDVSSLNARIERYRQDEPVDLRGPIFVAILGLFLIDSLVVILLSGALASLWRARRAAVSLVIGGVLGAVLVAFVLHSPLQAQPAVMQAQAQAPPQPPTKLQPPPLTQDELDFAMKAAQRTHLAYIITGDAAVDDVTKAGLQALTLFLAQRTALEPGEPIGLDPGRDELAFFPLIYWAISPNAAKPSQAVLDRIDAYMKQGGTILFDTRDAIEAPLGPGNAMQGPGMVALRAILSSLDIPELEPVSDNHVLTKTFFLLHDFPGRFTNGQLWAEALPAPSDDNASRPARAGDGVSSILITSNDFVGAWAIRADGDPILPTQSDDPRQREYAFRAGVNIVMYALTGNYKADQVHIPALLERLGQ